MCWKEQEALYNSTTVVHEIERLGEILINEIGIPIGIEHLTPSQSSFFKTVYRNPDRGVENFLANKT